MSYIADRVDLEDVRQPPLEAVGMSRASTVPIKPTKLVDVKQGLVGRGDGVVADRELYHSFSDYIEGEVPPHYRDFYICYDNCKDLIRHLNAANDAFQRGIEPDRTKCPLQVRSLLKETLQSLLVAHASAIDEGVVRAVVPQVRNMKCKMVKGVTENGCICACSLPGCFR